MVKIEIDYVKGPLSYLHNLWEFENLPDGGSKLHFEVDFEFKNKLFQKNRWRFVYGGSSSYGGFF